MKIQIIGYSGSGKSTLAKKLGEIYNLPVLHLDNTKFYGNWQKRTKEDQSSMVEKFLKENENWVIDGNYSKICPQRFEDSDVTIFLNFNRFVCFWNAYKRYKKHRKNKRDSCPCTDKFDREFRIWLLFKGRTKKRKQTHLENLNKTRGEKFIFHSRSQVNKYINHIQNILNNNI